MQQVFSTEPFIRDSYALSWDNYGYYLHLPAALIYHDPGIENKNWLDSLNKKYQPGRTFYQCYAGQKNRLVNTYPVGLAICNLPFFLGGHLAAKISGYSADGLSPPYQWAMIFSALCFAILGMFFFRKLLLRFFDDVVTTALLLLIAFGTNLFYYATYDCCLPHIFLFAIDCGILLLTISWHREQKRSTALFLGLLIGLATITRPSEIVWIIIPLFWNIVGWKSFIDKMKLLLKNFSHALLFVSGMIAVGSLQLFYWKYTSGNWFSYGHQEGFDFLHPFTLKVLFSYKKGWLLYTPVMALAILGFYYLYKNQRQLFFVFTLFSLVNLWVISSWECWWYAGTFGQRPFVQSYGLMAIPLGYFFIAWNKILWKKITVKFILLFFVLLNIFQTGQINAGILDTCRMTEKYYWKIFGRTTMNKDWMELLESDHYNPLPPLATCINKYNAKVVLQEDFENFKNDGSFHVLDSTGNRGKCIQLDAGHEFAITFRKPYNELTKQEYLRVELSADIFATDEFFQKPAYFAFMMNGKRGVSYGYTSVAIDTAIVKPGKWCHFSAEYFTPYILHESDELVVQLWDANHARLLVDNEKIILYEPKEK